MAESRNRNVIAAIAANALVFGTLGYVAYLHASDYDLYYRTLQEDEYLEWATFWAFMGGCVLSAVAAVRQHRRGLGLPWFLAGVSLFCFVVGMEEISWGQRVFSYRPPTYFLENNFQQELNVHNVMSTDFRKLAVKMVLGLYGVALPLLAVIPGLGESLRRFGVHAAPVALVPAFGAAYWLYEEYPWKYSGETVELMMGLSFMFAALWIARGLREEDPERSESGLAAAGIFVVAFVIVFGLGMANAQAARIRRATDPAFIDLARTEVTALEHDFEKIARRPGGRLTSSCSVHKRVYSYKEKYDKDELAEGEFAKLREQGLAEERAEFYIDPWNAPYWIRDNCPDSDEDTPRRTFVYSFGPNMRRDSSALELHGDDVGSYIYDTGPRD